jgi:hypothetical protein
MKDAARRDGPVVPAARIRRENGCSRPLWKGPAAPASASEFDAN